MSSPQPAAEKQGDVTTALNALNEQLNRYDYMFKGLCEKLRGCIRQETNPTQQPVAAIEPGYCPLSSEIYKIARQFEHLNGDLGFLIDHIET